MKSNICKNLLMLLGFALYFIGRLAIFPCADGQKHSFYHMTRPAFLDATDFRMLWNWFVAFILMIGIMLLMHKPNKIWGELGLADKRFCQSIGIGFLFTLPMFIVNAICGELDFTWTAIGISLMAGVWTLAPVSRTRHHIKFACRSRNRPGRNTIQLDVRGMELPSLDSHLPTHLYGCSLDDSPSWRRRVWGSRQYSNQRGKSYHNRSCYLGYHLLQTQERREML